ncbi:MAG: hypothetical protein HEP71_30855 [Roseivirga sp.]|nr:hypothetical protein [Roseivirga sp.]
MAKIKLDFGFSLVAPDMTETGEPAYKVVCSLLGFRSSEKPAEFLKSFELVQDLNKNKGKLELDEADTEMLKELIKTHKSDPQRGIVGIPDITKALLYKAFPTE